MIFQSAPRVEGEESSWPGEQAQRSTERTEGQLAAVRGCLCLRAVPALACPFSPDSDASTSSRLNPRPPSSRHPPSPAERCLPSRPVTVFRGLQRLSSTSGRRRLNASRCHRRQPVSCLGSNSPLHPPSTPMKTLPSSFLTPQACQPTSITGSSLLQSPTRVLLADARKPHPLTLLRRLSPALSPGHQQRPGPRSLHGQPSTSDNGSTLSCRLAGSPSHPRPIDNTQAPDCLPPPAAPRRLAPPSPQAARPQAGSSRPSRCRLR